jgi:ABC-2 type transport system ATP-binding protein
MSGIEIKDIAKNYGRVCALDHINLHFQENKIYGLLGRNGAGKSTLLNLITNRIFPDSGEILVDGEAVMDNGKALSKLYLMDDRNYYAEKMKIKKVFEWTKCFYPNFDGEYAKALSDQFELNINKTVKSLSTGYSSIFKLIIALSVNTPYVLLDEPVLGLDANHRDLFYRTLIQKFSENPCTIVISTHLIEEVSNVIEDIIIIKKGSILKNESCEELLSKGYTVSGNTSAVDAYIAGKNVIGSDILGGLKTAYILGKTDSIIPENLEVSKLDLQKLFIQLTNSER